MSKPLLDQRWPWLLAAAVLLLVFLYSLIEVASSPGRGDRPAGSVDDLSAFRERGDTNILFILIDMLRADRLGSYGYERDTSPVLDQLAAGGVRFERHLAQSSWTKASMASLWTGLYPVHSGITRFDDVIPEVAELPAEVLARNGFTTAGIYRNGWVAPTFGFHQGFEVYTRPAPRPAGAAVRRENPTVTVRGTDEDAAAAAVEFLRIHGHGRWFLYLHLMDVHEYLYDEETALFGGSYSDIYDNSIRWTDRIIGLLMEYLDDMGLSDRTLVVIGSDHGEAFRERGHEGHARQVYGESTEVPLILHFPFRLEPGIEVGVRTQNVDLWPTLYELVGVEGPSGLDGRSLVPEIVAAAQGAPPALPDRTAVAHLDQTWGQRGTEPRDTVAVANGALRYVRTQDRGRRIERLFDHSEDPAELRDRAAEDPESLERLRTTADAYLESDPTWGEPPTREIGELELNQLRALGYAIP